MAWLLWLILVPLGVCLGVFVLGTLLAFLTPCPSPKLHDRFLYFWARRYLRIIHRWRVEGAKHVPMTGGVLLVANHTAGLDPILVSTCCPRTVRWIMALDMRLPQLEWFWKWQQIIFVGREGKAAPDGSSPGDRGAAGVRAALEELSRGGVVGIYPEGGIERPPEMVMPFQAGVGLMIRKAKVPVVPVWISGTAPVDPAWASLWHRSKSRVVFGEPIDYTDKKMSAAEIAADLRQWMLKTSGWPMNDTSPAMREKAEALARSADQPGTSVA
ncbi:MAG: 1-acyl-sn-glycerol-3-phosphate acyltransferase [Phycisphaerales bacterium]